MIRYVRFAGVVTCRPAAGGSRPPATPNNSLTSLLIVVIFIKLDNIARPGILKWGHNICIILMKYDKKFITST